MRLLTGPRTPADLLMREPSALLGRTDRNGFAPTTENQALSNWSDLRGHGARDYFYNWDINETQTTTEGDGESQSPLNWWWGGREKKRKSRIKPVVAPVSHDAILGMYWKPRQLKKKKKSFPERSRNSLSSKFRCFGGAPIFKTSLWKRRFDRS